MNKQSIIESLQLQPHVEGGYFRRSYCSEHTAPITETVKRPLMSSIYYLLSDDSPIGYFHRNHSDIVHYWHAGSALNYLLINPNGELTTTVLGPDISQGQQLQLMVPGGYWKATYLADGEYGLLSEAVSPGFDYDDMTLATAKQMQQDFPGLWQRKALQLSRYCKR